MDYTQAVKSLLHKFQTKDVTITHVYDGDEWTKCDGNKLYARHTATEVITSVDFSMVRIVYNEEVAKLVIVLGNDESEILADWLVKPETQLDKIIEEVSEEFCNQWEKV